MSMPKSVSKSTVRARDLMHTELVKLDADASLTRAVETLNDAGVSGAPVIDASERLVGVFTLRDAARGEVEVGQRYGERQAPEPVEPDWDEDDVDEGERIERVVSMRDDYGPSTSRAAQVGEWMNPKVISVAPDAGLREVCRVMADERIHRVFVVEGRKLVGVISALDVVAHVARG
jgi:CBS domain-containing protein